MHNQTNAELAVIPSCSGVNLPKEVTLIGYLENAFFEVHNKFNIFKSSRISVHFSVLCRF